MKKLSLDNLNGYFNKLMNFKLKKNSNEVDNNLIDVNKLIEKYTVEELCQTAEAYFNRLTNLDYHLSKPFASIDEAPDLLINFSNLIRGLQLLPDLTVLDFGSGSCWTSRLINQMGCSVISLDPSISALKIGEELKKKQPVIGKQPEHIFLNFNGKKIDLPNESVDRIFCFDAFHHVPNQSEILNEMFRVLKKGGIAGFSEPGRDHSKSHQSQYEMRNYKVIENDIIIEDIFDHAKKAGFTDFKVSIFGAECDLVSLNEYKSFLDGRELISNYYEKTINSLKNKQIFFIYKDRNEIFDSRARPGLIADIKINIKSSIINESEIFQFEAALKNISDKVWLPSGNKKGSVNLGIHLLNKDNSLINLDYFRSPLTQNDNRKIMPGEEIKFKFNVPSPKSGQYILEFDLVSESICWFQQNGSKTVTFNVEIKKVNT